MAGESWGETGEEEEESPFRFEGKTGEENYETSLYSHVRYTACLKTMTFCVDIISRIERRASTTTPSPLDADRENATATALDFKDVLEERRRRVAATCEASTYNDFANMELSLRNISLKGLPQQEAPLQGPWAPSAREGSAAAVVPSLQGFLVHLAKVRVRHLHGDDRGSKKSSFCRESFSEACKTFSFLKTDKATM